MIFLSSDLLVSDEQLNTLSAALASQGQPDPVSACIAGEIARVEAMTAGYEIPAGWLKSLVRALVLQELYARLPTGRVPQNVADAWAEARKDLEEIRNGRYQSLAVRGALNNTAPNAIGLKERPHPHRQQNQEGL
jgi:hypothetical protein